MSENASTKAYEGDGITVTYDRHRCLHAAECVRGLPEVFDTTRRPWIQPSAAEPGATAEVVRRCPTGALHYQLTTGPAEQGDAAVRITTGPGQPLVINGSFTIDDGSGPRSETRATLCRCGQTANAPYCSGAGDCTDWPRQ